MDVSGWRSHQTVTTYDADGRVSEVDESGRPGQSGWLWGSRDPDLTALSKVLYSNSSGASGYDAAGRLTTYRYQHLSSAFVPTAQAYTHTYTTLYEARDTYLEKSVSGTSDNTSYKPTTTTSTYDPTGRRVALTQITPAGRFHDQQLAAYGEDGTIDAATQLTAFDSSDLGTEPALVPQASARHAPR